MELDHEIQLGCDETEVHRGECEGVAVAGCCSNLNCHERCRNNRFRKSKKDIGFEKRGDVGHRC